MFQDKVLAVIKHIVNNCCKEEENKPMLVILWIEKIYMQLVLIMQIR